MHSKLGRIKHTERMQNIQSLQDVPAQCLSTLTTFIHNDN